MEKVEQNIHREVFPKSLNFLPMELIRFQAGEKEEKIKEEKKLKAMIKDLKDVIEGWGNFFDECEESPLWEKYGKLQCQYFKSAVKPGVIDRDNKEIQKEYEKYKEKKGRDKLKRKIKDLEYEKKLLQEAYEECCGK